MTTLLALTITVTLALAGIAHSISWWASTDDDGNPRDRS